MLGFYRAQKGVSINELRVYIGPAVRLLCSQNGALALTAATLCGDLLLGPLPLGGGQAGLHTRQLDWGRGRLQDSWRGKREWGGGAVGVQHVKDTACMHVGTPHTHARTTTVLKETLHDSRHALAFCDILCALGGGGARQQKKRTVWGAGGGARCGASTDSHASTPTAKLDRSCRRRANRTMHPCFRHSCPREAHTFTGDKQCRSLSACVTSEQVKRCLCASITRCAT